MFGKIFATMFTGSMVGSGPLVFAVWSYVIANASDSIVELNPTLLAATIGDCSAGEVTHAIGVLQKPDPNSRCKDHDGARLVHIEAFRYFVVTAEHYRNLRDSTDRKEYMRGYMRKYMKAKRKGDAQPDLLNTLSNVKQGLAHTETESETESETEGLKAQAAKGSSDDDPSRFSFTLIGDDVYTVSVGMLTLLRETYPGVDVEGQLRKIKAWCISNPTLRKTPRGAARFVNSWMDRAQNEAARNGGARGRSEQTGGAPSDRPLQRKPRA